ncbi:caspase family protein [Streptomyces abyssomicinicus]|uniref:caspase family protein n=1 Tax=Streptomyces abyssomicinicus TaxID=574929 RepID=UPI00350E480B
MAANQHQRTVTAQTGGESYRWTRQPVAPDRSTAHEPGHLEAGSRPTCPDPRESRAVVVGASRQGTALPGVEASALKLAEHLGNLGVPRTVTLIGDEATPHAAISALRTAAAEATDTLIFYFAGHGTTDLHGDLILGSSSSNDLPDAALPFTYVHDLVRGSQANRTLVILDACASGSALADFSDRTDSKDATSGGPKEEYVLTATGPDGWALDRDPANPASPYTAFTTALFQVLTDQGADVCPYLDVPTLHRALSRRLANAALPTPHLFTRSDGTQSLALAPKPATHYGRFEDPGPNQCASQPTGDIASSAEAEPSDRSRRRRSLGRSGPVDSEQAR